MLGLCPNTVQPILEPTGALKALGLSFLVQLGEGVIKDQASLLLFVDGIGPGVTFCTGMGKGVLNHCF